MLQKDVDFSIIIPSYNRARSIQQTIYSVLEQSYKNFELIIVDDGSTDNTKEVVSKINDPRITYIFQENKERGAARNTGIKNSRAQYVTFLDSDDRLYPNHLEEAILAIKAFAKPEWFHLPYDIRNAVGKLIQRPSIQLLKLKQPEIHLLKGNPLSCMGVFVKRDILLNNLFHEDRTLSGSEDWELWVRLGCHYPLLIHEKVTSCLIQHENRSVINQNEFKIISRIEKAKELTLSNECFKKRWWAYNGLVSSHLYAYASLHLAMAGNKRLSLKYIFKAINNNFTFIFTRKFLGIIKAIFIS